MVNEGKGLELSNDVFMNYLQNAFGKDAPIFIEEIKYSNFSQTQILNTLTSLCESGEIIKFDEGTYYIPTDDPLLGKSVLSAKDIFEKKYIRNGNDVYGFYGGIAIQNYLGLSTQVVVTPTIFTNKITENEKREQVGWRDIILKKGRTTITADNVHILTLLELFSEAPEWWFRDKDENKLKKLGLYIKEKKITEQDIRQYLPLFSSETAKKFRESGVICYATR